MLSKFFFTIRKKMSYTVKKRAQSLRSGGRMTVIIDYGAGNIKSVENALLLLGEKVRVTNVKSEILSAERVILPGVGAFGDAMKQLRNSGLDKVIRQVVAKGIPLLGICLGLQLLFESSEESPGVSGLGILKGKVLKIPKQPGLKIPHMGWNSLDMKPDSRLFTGLDENTYVYFVHSYYLVAEEERIVKAVTHYGTTIHAAIEAENVFACQFHPEKSGTVGLQILKNFINVT